MNRTDGVGYIWCCSIDVLVLQFSSSSMRRRLRSSSLCYVSNTLKKRTNCSIPIYWLIDAFTHPNPRGDHNRINDERHSNQPAAPIVDQWRRIHRCVALNLTKEYTFRRESTESETFVDYSIHLVSKWALFGREERATTGQAETT